MRVLNSRHPERQFFNLMLRLMPTLSFCRINAAYFFQQQFHNMDVVFPGGKVKRCLAFEVNKSYSADRWVFAD